MNKKFSKIIGVLLAFVLVGGMVASFVPAPKATAKEYTYDTCQQELAVTLEWRSLEFSVYLDRHFQSKDNNTDLIAEAINGYREFRNEVMAELGKYKVGILPNTEQLQAYDGCIRLAQKYIANAKTMLKKHVLTVSKIKQTTILLEKYKSINEKLSEMNMTIAKIIGAFETMKNKLPGYLKDCL